MGLFPCPLDADRAVAIYRKNVGERAVSVPQQRDVENRPQRDQINRHAATVGNSSLHNVGKKPITERDEGRCDNGGAQDDCFQRLRGALLAAPEGQYAKRE